MRVEALKHLLSLSPRGTSSCFLKRAVQPKKKREKKQPPLGFSGLFSRLPRVNKELTFVRAASRWHMRVDASAWAVRRRLMAARCVYGFSRRRQTASLITAARGERLTRSRRRRRRGSRWELSAVGRKTLEKARVSYLRQQGGGNFCHFLPQYIYFFFRSVFCFSSPRFRAPPPRAAISEERPG